MSALQTWLFWRSGSLWPAILAHAAFNSIQFALAFQAYIR
jgi:membrane protease YdiL (CAAX protease family)